MKVNKMNWKSWLEKWDMTSLKLTAPFGELEWKPVTPDKDAAWELYIELLTRITTQPLGNHQGDEETALASIFSLFGISREIIKSHGRACIEFTKIAIIVLNQIIRPFTAKWHKISIEKKLKDADICKEFRLELANLQKKLQTYSRMLAEMADVEDITNLEEER